MDIIEVAKKRYTCKAFSTKKIPDEVFAKVRQLLQLSASSTNIQPWRFVIASTEAGKARVVKAAAEKYPFNAPSLTKASHVVVFASRVDFDEDYLQKILAQEEADGRFPDLAVHKPAMHQGRSFFANMNKDNGVAEEWMANQVYLNLGGFLLGVAALGLDATPMEGVDMEALDAEFGFDKAGYKARFVVPVGYADVENDYNRGLPKSRLPESEIIEEI